jgi:AraC-like DNA-binding protein
MAGMAERLFLRLDDDPLHGPESSVPAGTLRAFPVGAALRGHVSHLMLYRERFAPGHEVRERVLPDGAVRLVFNFGDAPSADGAEGLAVEAIGACAAPVVVRMRRLVEGLSVTCRPGAAAALLGLPAGEIGGGAVHLDALWRGDGARLLERMREAPDDAARVALLRAALQRRLGADDAAVRQCRQRGRHARGTAHHRGRRATAVARSGGGRGRRRAAAAAAVPCACRPAAARMEPARAAACLPARAARAALAGWADVALEGGFFDQSHLANEFRALCGVTPTEFMGRAISGSSKTAG